MEMVSRLFNQHGSQLLKEGKISQATIDEAVRRILRIKFRLGLFEHPYTDEAREKTSLVTASNRAVARLSRTVPCPIEERARKLR